MGRTEGTGDGKEGVLGLGFWIEPELPHQALVAPGATYALGVGGLDFTTP